MHFLKCHVSCLLWLFLGGFKQTWFNLEDWQLGKGHKFFVFLKEKVSCSLSSAALFCFLAGQHKVLLPIVVIWVGQEYNCGVALWGSRATENILRGYSSAAPGTTWFIFVLGENLFETSKVHELSGSRVSYILFKLFSKLLLFCKCNSTMSLNAELFGLFLSWRWDA